MPIIKSYDIIKVLWHLNYLVPKIKSLQKYFICYNKIIKLKGVYHETKKQLSL
ncbi:hypothetical protein ACEW7V_03125 [Areca yellow leaf disease phytoplasma]|uniref:hypothetical protein n=1 Tax=Areca yellow leaf disease phytoplasma TaxID=927614 RepID=UPI0035B567CD